MPSDIDTSGVSISETDQFDFFDTYLRDGFDKIEGWPGRKESVNFLRNFRELFSAFGEKGGVCEIGMYHARHFIALHNVMPQSKSLGLDLFEQQDRNVDGSGQGSREICSANIERFACNPHLVTLRAIDSITIKEKDRREIVDEFGLFSLFSVDGGHTPLHVTIDFLTASNCTSSNGVILIDDIFHPDWPGVTEGMYHILGTETSPFVPFMLTRKKLYLCSVSRQKQFANFVLERRGDVPCKLVDFGRWIIPSLHFGGEY